MKVKIGFQTKSGIDCHHEKEAIMPITKLIRKYNPELIIELGTKCGGFTEVLQDSTGVETDIYTYDVKECQIRGIFRDNVYFKTVDIFGDAINEIISLCSDKRKKILYCDNGNKIKEVRYYAKHINGGDILGVHDWGYEIGYDDVNDVLADFIPYWNQPFISAGFTSRFWQKKLQKGQTNE